jgi:hypothetical protein
MLSEARKALWITTTAFDSELVRRIRAGYADLEMAGVRLPGIVDFTESNGVYTDNSTLEDPAAVEAILTYVAAKFGNPPNYDKLLASYETQKVQLMHATGYTDWGGDCG